MKPNLLLPLISLAIVISPDPALYGQAKEYHKPSSLGRRYDPEGGHKLTYSTANSAPTLRRISIYK